MEDRQYSTSNLFTFESVVDMDLAIMNFMIAKYGKSPYFDPLVYNASSENVKKNLLLARKPINPITVLLKEDFHNSADDMLKDIKENYIEEVMEYAKPNDILRFIKTLETSDGIISSAISCKNQLQKQYIKNLDNSLAIIGEETNMGAYDSLFLKYVEDIIHYKNMGGKYIFILNYMHNIDEETGTPKKIILTVSGSNKVRTVDPYIGLIFFLIFGIDN